MTVRVPAKINLSLGVGQRRSNGYHGLATVYQAVDVYDEVRATAVAGNQITVTVHFEREPLVESGSIPLDEDNLAVRAANLVREAAGIDDGVDLAIRKVIPVAGGMAGGSADAAASLLAVNELWGAGLSRDELDALAAKLGSDVPFLLHGGTAIGGGRGEVISPVLARGHYHWVFAIAARGLSTSQVYTQFDALSEGSAVADPQIAPALMAALRAGDAKALGAALSNDLTQASFSLRPELAEVMQLGLDCHVHGALISGSGPTVMFLVEDEAASLDVAMALSTSPWCADVVQARGPVPGARII